MQENFGVTQYLAERSSPDRIRRLGPLLDDASHDLEENRRAVLEVAPIGATFLVPSEQRHLAQRAFSQKFGKDLIYLFIGDAGLRVEAPVS